MQIGSPQVVGPYSRAPGVQGGRPPAALPPNLSSRREPEPPDPKDGFSWKGGALLALTLTGVAAGIYKAPTITQQASAFTRSFDELSQDNWERLIGPRAWEEEEVTPGLHSSRSAPSTIAETREKVQGLTFLEIDPFVASVANAVDAQMSPRVKGEQKLKLQVEGYAKTFEVDLALVNGPDAPLVVLLPGIYGDGGGGQTKALKSLAVERGMNYMVIPNALGEEAMKDDPAHHPGNPRLEAIISYDILTQVADLYPGHFEQVSVAGYSYGGLLGANLVRYEEELSDQIPGAKRLINGSLVAISPADNLSDSMQELDGLRVHYQEGQAGSIIWNGLKYRRQVRSHGYESFMETELALRGQGSNQTEIKLADLYGSRNGMKDMIDRVDRQFDHRQLPLNRPNAPRRRGGGSRHRDHRYNRVRAAHRRALDEATYVQFRDQFFAKDDWLKEHQMTPDEMAERYSFTHAMEVIDDTPVLTLLSADDYILNQGNVEHYRELERHPGPQEVTRVFDHGGHVGILFNPEVKEVVLDFAHHPPHWEEPSLNE